MGKEKQENLVRPNGPQQLKLEAGIKQKNIDRPTKERIQKH